MAFHKIIFINPAFIIASLFMLEMAQAIQEYRACENSFQCTTFCNNKGFNDRVCKTVTVDESPNIDGTALVNRRVCLCSESKEEGGGNSATGEYFNYWFSPGHECIRNGSDKQCKEYCKRIRIDPETKFSKSKSIVMQLFFH
ncbi:guanine nucleotide-binding protein g alpha subunit [Dermatophagoides farinae]|uniref:Guanine nucleotide-binding protein g alpha subunit n=1 Tax=Dermatophagoides farinae TaxID=6954 RepID=A0A9D4SK25_DERFA|nr:guanine nucleotide-binding protein g alpha subunit [Dermatophagoides farinae]